MTTTIRTRHGDMVDAICWRTFGATAGYTEQVFELNPGLSRHAPVLPAGLLITLPDKPATVLPPPTIKLWD